MKALCRVKTEFTNLRYSTGTEGDHQVFAPYDETGKHIQLKKGTELDVEDASTYGDSAKTKKYNTSHLTVCIHK